MHIDEFMAYGKTKRRKRKETRWQWWQMANSKQYTETHIYATTHKDIHVSHDTTNQEFGTYSLVQCLFSFIYIPDFDVVGTHWPLPYFTRHFQWIFSLELQNSPSAPMWTCFTIFLIYRNEISNTLKQIIYAPCSQSIPSVF